MLYLLLDLDIYYLYTYQYFVYDARVVRIDLFFVVSFSFCVITKYKKYKFNLKINFDNVTLAI